MVHLFDNNSWKCVCVCACVCINMKTGVHHHLICTIHPSSVCIRAISNGVIQWIIGLIEACGQSTSCELSRLCIVRDPVLKIRARQKIEYFSVHMHCKCNAICNPMQVTDAFSLWLHAPQLEALSERMQLTGGHVPFFSPGIQRRCKTLPNLRMQKDQSAVRRFSAGFPTYLFAWNQGLGFRRVCEISWTAIRYRDGDINLIPRWWL